MTTQRQYASEIVDFILSVARAAEASPAAKDKAIMWTKLKLDALCARDDEDDGQPDERQEWHDFDPEC